MLVSDLSHPEYTQSLIIPVYRESRQVSRPMPEMAYAIIPPYAVDLGRQLFHNILESVRDFLPLGNAWQTHGLVQEMSASLWCTAHTGVEWVMECPRPDGREAVKNPYYDFFTCPASYQSPQTVKHGYLGRDWCGCWWGVMLKARLHQPNSLGRRFFSISHSSMTGNDQEGLEYRSKEVCFAQVEEALLGSDYKGPAVGHPAAIGMWPEGNADDFLFGIVSKIDKDGIDVKIGDRTVRTPHVFDAYMDRHNRYTILDH